MNCKLIFSNFLENTLSNSAFNCQIMLNITQTEELFLYKDLHKIKKPFLILSETACLLGDLGEIRTPDPRLRRPLLYPTELLDQLERAMGIEPTTSAWKAEVLPLNYTRNLLSNALCIWSERQDSNLRPPAPKAGALPS